MPEGWENNEGAFGTVRIDAATRKARVEHNDRFVDFATSAYEDSETPQTEDLGMAHPYHHALSSAHRWGGQPEDYLQIHQWLDESKAYLGDFRHRALRHHAEGIFLCERLFGVTLTNSAGRVVPVRWVAEEHVKEDLGRIPSASDWLRCIRPEPWMGRAQRVDVEEVLVAESCGTALPGDAG